MLGEDSASYSDAQSSLGDTSPIVSSNSDKEVEPLPKRRSATSLFLRSESLFLALLFAVIALLLPTFFSFASNPSSPASPENESSDSTETRSSPLIALLPYIPAASTVFRFSFSAFHLLLRPFIAILSVILALLAPIFLVLNILFQSLVILPSRLVAELARFFYPIYLFCGVACLFGAGIGLGGRLLVEGSKVIMFAGTYDGASDRKGKKKLA